MFGASASHGTTVRNVSLPGLTATATGHPDGNEIMASGEVGYATPLDSTFNLVPFGGLDIGSANQRAFVETGGGVLNLAVAGHTTNSVRSILGTRINGANLTLGDTPISTELKLGWAHEFSDRNPIANETFAGQAGTNFTVSGAPISRDSAVVGLGLAAAIATGANVYLHYEGEFSDISTSHTISGGISFTW